MKTNFVSSKYWANKFLNYQPLAVWSALPSTFSVISFCIADPDLQQDPAFSSLLFVQLFLKELFAK